MLFIVIAEGIQHLKDWEYMLAPPHRHYQFNSGPVPGAFGVAETLLNKAGNSGSNFSCLTWPGIGRRQTCIPWSECFESLCRAEDFWRGK